VKIRYEVGDMFAGPQRVLVHGCNAKGVMGSGVAKIVRDQYPQAYRAYRDAYEKFGLKPGDVVLADCGDRTIVNAVTQDDYGRDPSRIYVDYDAVAKCMRAINNIAPGEEVGMPMIGSGLARGDWNRIAEIIERESREYQPVVWVLDAGLIPTVAT